MKGCQEVAWEGACLQLGSAVGAVHVECLPLLACLIAEAHAVVGSGGQLSPDPTGSAYIRSAKQDDIYGASNILLPCPGS